MSNAPFRRGMEFEHKTWRDATGNPLRCRITAVRSGVVYWKPVAADGSLGGSMYCDIDVFPTKIGTLLSAGTE
jgi:hypothetical protein